MRGLLIAILFGLELSCSAQAGELREFYRGTRASAMGGAFSAIADDEQAIFMNPAGLVGVKGLTLNYAAADIEASWDMITSGMAGLAGASNFTAATLNEYMGKNIYFHAQIAPSLVMPGFGISFLSDHQVALDEQNQAFSNINLGYQSTNGIQAAFGFSVLGRRVKRSDLRVGVAAKLMWRRGGYHQLGFLEILALTENTNYVSEITGDYGRGIGADLGTQYLFNVNKRLTLSTALVMTDIGDTSFGDSLADPQKSNLTFGLGATYKMRRAKVNLAYDYRHILAATDFRSRSHVGLELVLPIVSIQGGVYQSSLSYGASVELWILRLIASSYAEEQATYATQNPERRYSLRLALKFGF